MAKAIVIDLWKQIVHIIILNFDTPLLNVAHASEKALLYLMKVQSITGREHFE